ncbi:hypothetical protein ACODT3_24370 [Streptomyces sp. 4.24]|uniref:hypothetical protein n=1 Tax=Streptomyces tritrimontium TaxID=3406573 RepID=UPI003BB7B1C3
MESLSSEAPRTIERLHALSTGLGAFGELLIGTRPVAGSGGLPTLASWYATAQGLSTTALVLLLHTAEQPYAHTTMSGHLTVEVLGELAKTSSDITAHVMDAVAMAAKYHRLDSYPDSANEPPSAQPAVRRLALDEHLDRAAALIKPARAACHNAATFTETASLRQATRTAESAPVPELNLAERHALRLIANDPVLLTADRSTRQVWTGSGERISTETVDSLTDKHLIRLDASGSPATGQRLRVTDQGRRALDTPGNPSTLADPSPAVTQQAAPARTARPPKLNPTQHRALHLIHTSTVTYAQWPRKRPTVNTGSPERISTRTVDALQVRRLIGRDVRTGLHEGQRLLLTAAGREALLRLGPAPEPGVPAPARRTGPALTR